ARPADAEGSAEDVFRDPEQRDARGYILPSSQLDFPAATRFLNTLMKAGVEVQRASRDFSAGGKRYRKGSYVVKAAQAFRAHVLDMFEPQWHPDDVGQGGEPLRPYDSAGWTLAMQMGVVFDRVLDGFEGPFERLRDFAPTPAGSVSDGQVGWLMSHKDSNSYRCTNRLLAKGERLYWMKEADRHPFASYPAGTVFVRRGPHTRQRLEVLAKELGVTFHGLDRRPGGPCLELGKPRIGLFDVYGGNMPTGWTRWALEQFEFPVEPVFGKRIQEGELERDYDVLIFHTGLPRTPAQARARAAGGRGSGRRRRARSPVTPEEARRVAAALPPFEDWSGVAERLVQLTHEESIPVLRSFVEAGGTILALGGQATALSDHFRLPIREGTWKDEEGEERRTKRSEFFIPGSLLRVEVDTGELLGYGMPERCTAMFRRSPVFRIDRHRDDAARVSVAVRYAREDLLASGWAIGEEYLEGLAAVLSVRLGKGRVHLYGADVMYRGQPWSTFKLVFNGILGAAAKELDELR
ncbi:MAG: peptidase, partial [Planctomycetota bacterium]